MIFSSSSRMNSYLALFTSLLCTAPVARAITIEAVADIWIRESDPTGAYADDLLSVWNGDPADQRRHSVVVFDLSSTTSETITSVYLDLYDRDDGVDGRSENSPLVQQAFLLSPTPGPFISDISSVEAYTWDEYITFDAGTQQTLDSLGAYDIAAGDTINGYQASDLASSADISLLEQVRDSNSNLVVFVLQAVSGSRDWGDIEFDNTPPRLVINEDPTVPGDISGNGSVGLEDYSIMNDPLNWLQEVPAGTRGDLNSDGVVNLIDFKSFKPIFLQANPQLSLTGGGNVVPEPASWSLCAFLGLGGVATNRWRRKPLPFSARVRSSVTCTMAVLAVLLGMLVLPVASSAVTVTESYDAWIRDEGLTVGDRDGDWLGVYNSNDGARPARWAVLEFDLSGLAPLSINQLQMGFWHMFPGSPVGSSDSFPVSQTVSMITEVNATTATADFTWGQLNDPAQVTLTPFDSLGAIDLQGLAADPSEADRYHYGAASAADISAVQPLLDSGGTLRVVVQADDTVPTDQRVDWGDGPNDGDESHGQSAILLINETPPEFVELTLQIDTVSGAMTIVNPGIDPAEDTMFDIDGYVIESPAGALNPGGFTGLTGSGESGWQIVAPAAGALSETALTSSTLFAEGTSKSLGTGYTPGAGADSELTFEYSVEGVAGTTFGVVEFVSGPGVAGDYNGDGVVNLADYTVWRDALGESIALNNENPAATTPGVVDIEDYTFWQSQFSAATANAKLADQAAVPEPTTGLLLGLFSTAFAYRSGGLGRFFSTQVEAE